MAGHSIPCPKIVPGQERLTPEQEEYARQFAQERIASMLSTTAIDEQEAERHLRAAYKVAGLPAPVMRWFDSPIAFADATMRATVGATVGDTVWATVWAYLDENWLAFYRFFSEVFQENDLIHLALFNEMVSGYRLGSKEAWLVRKPVRLERDEQGRLHSATGMCMQYRDGWGFYAWHGVRVPEKPIMAPEQLTKQDWVEEDNLEIRRVIQERMGDRFVLLLDGKVVDTGKRGTLYEVDVRPDPERMVKYLHVKDTSTEREYYLRVPPSVKTAQEACAWTFGLSEEEYQPVQEA